MYTQLKLYIHFQKISRTPRSSSNAPFHLVKDVRKEVQALSLYCTTTSYFLLLQFIFLTTATIPTVLTVPTTVLTMLSPCCRFLAAQHCPSLVPISPTTLQCWVFISLKETRKPRQQLGKWPRDGACSSPSGHPGLGPQLGCLPSGPFCLSWGSWLRDTPGQGRVHASGTAHFWGQPRPGWAQTLSWGLGR